MQDVINRVWDIEAVYFDLCLLLNTVMLSVMTYHQLCSAVILLMPVLFPTVLRLGAVGIFRLSPYGIYSIVCVIFGYLFITVSSELSRQSSVF